MRSLPRWMMLGLLCLGISGCQKSPAFLPADGAGIARSERPRSFSGKRLYAYIDGGADIFNEYGFEKVWVQCYQKAGREIVLEAYEMSDPAAAAGIYSHKRRPGSERELAPGLPAEVTETQVSICKGVWYVVVRAGDLSPGLEQDLAGVCRQVASKLEGVPGRDILNKGLAVEGKLEGTEVLIEGPLGLRVRPWLSGLDGTALDEAWLASFQLPEGKAEALWARFTSPEAAGQGFSNLLSGPPGLAAASKGSVLTAVKGEAPQGALEALSQNVLSLKE